MRNVFPMPLLTVLILLVSVGTGFVAGDDPVAEVDETMGVYRLRERQERRLVQRSDLEELRIFCHDGGGPELTGFWSSAEMRLRIDSDDYHVYVAENVSSVQAMHRNHKATWFYSSLPWKSKSVKLNPFEDTCVGVLARDEYVMTLQKYRVNYWQVVVTFAGIALFCYAPSLCRNVFFHYATGMAAGVFLSLVVVSYLVQRRFSLGKWVVACYSLSVYFLSSIWYNIKTYLVQHHVYVLGYLVGSALVSFAACYRMGPVENQRTVNLIQWSLQLFALILVYLSSYHQVASLGLAVGLVSWSVVPASWKTQLQVQYKRKFVKPKVKLLTETEYLDQSRIETKRALDALRDYCRSPKCNAWKVSKSLSSPTRFAEFVEGSSHVTQEEVINYSQISDFDDDLMSEEDHFGANLLEEDEEETPPASNGQVEQEMTDDESIEEQF